MTEERYEEIQSYYSRVKTAERELKRLTALRDDAKRVYEGSRTKDIYCLVDTMFHNREVFADTLPKYFFDHMDNMIHKAENELNYQKSVFEGL